MLEEHEMQSFVDLDLEELPRKMELSRRAGDTTRYMLVEPLPERSRSKVEALVAHFQQTVTRSSFFDLTLADEPEVIEDWTKRKTQVLEGLDALTTQLIEAVSADQLREVVPSLRDQLAELQESAEALQAETDAQQAIATLLEWVDADHPGSEVRRRLGEMLPVALFFSEGDRTLPSTFPLSEDTLRDLPASVQNLANMAELSLSELLSEIEDDHRAAHGTRIRRANAVLQRKFNASWRQSNLSVALNLESSTIYIEILQDDDIVTPIHERSAGLRMYVALVAFLEQRTHDIKPILLIDEAETHLHLDAQADLVASFSRQQEVAKIIYTTHSPACLPADLGTNVRAVLPHATRSQESTLENSFWRNASGYTPLMIAMGAGASAFAAARYVVLAEGASEMLVLPSLIRAATDLIELPYQVAPGLSESSPEDYEDLDLEGARVAFLVDDDAGGVRLKKKLIAAGVSPHKIVQLGELMLEHLFEPEVYKNAYAQLLREWNPTATIPNPPSFSEHSKVPRPKQLDAWAKSIPDLHIPGKRDVASFIAEHGKAIPSENGAAKLQSLHIGLIGALGIKTKLKTEN
ncbi:hypothetical protein BLJ79_18060 [Arthrobacter sp. UCD-GKA]|nr:hypothetical protein BLJ79_18060 [Arthrobacter sp. UCD-GKA]